ncbi:MAG: alkaline phosphatase family protein [Pyrinomonadaceae bacterium]|nr:alkaline phosphatase family protein [Pyrinomonadaceae bacterium]
MNTKKTAYNWFCIVAVLLILTVWTNAQKPIKDLKPTIILIAVDGFRADYFEKHGPPTLNKIASEGVRAKWMTPSFPSKTFPNHYTVATGLYPAHHGIVENNIWDFGVVFSMGKREEVQNGRWWLGQPIWVTAEKQGQRAAAMFFPGTEARIDGIYSTYWTPYEHTYPIDKRVDNVLGWIDLPVEKRPTMYTLYFSDVDSAGHEYSPDAAETRDAVLKVDTAIARLVDGLKKRKIYGKVNLIFFSDHGMSLVDKTRTAILDDYFDFNLTQNILWTGEIVQIFPKDGQKEVIAEKLKNVTNAKCWRKEDIPDRLHYKDGPRVAPIICSADDGAMLTSRQRLADAKKRPNFDKPSGAHGYDNELESMRAMFVGHGKAFKKGKIADPFPNVDVYNLMCKILGLTPAPNDGDFDRVRKMLR